MNSEKIILYPFVKCELSDIYIHMCMYNVSEIRKIRECICEKSYLAVEQVLVRIKNLKTSTG